MGINPSMALIQLTARGKIGKKVTLLRHGRPLEVLPARDWQGLGSPGRGRGRHACGCRGRHRRQEAARRERRLAGSRCINRRIGKVRPVLLVEPRDRQGAARPPSRTAGSARCGPTLSWPLPPWMWSPSRDGDVCYWTGLVVRSGGQGAGGYAGDAIA